MKKKKEEACELTLRGLFETLLSPEGAGEVIDTLELYMRRHYYRNAGDYPVIMLDVSKNCFAFGTASYIGKIKAGEKK